MATLTCDEANTTLVDVTLPPVVIHKTMVLDVSIEFDIESFFERSSSSYSKPGRQTFTLGYKELNKLPHDIIAECLGYDSTDKPLSGVYILQDDTDKLTPDVIIQDEKGNFTIIEIKTSRSHYGVNELFNSAKRKYYDAIQARLRAHDITYFVIVVFPHGIVTNMKMTMLQTETLVQHYLFAIHLQDTAKKFGWDPESVLPEKENIIRFFAESFKYDKKEENCRGEAESLHITKQTLRNWENLEDPGIKRIFDINMKSAKEIWSEEIIVKDDERTSRDIEICAKRISAFFKKVANLDTKDSVKAVIRHPLFTVRSPSPYTSSWRSNELFDMYFDNSTYGTLYSQAAEACLADEESRFETLLSTEDEDEIRQRGYWTPPPGDKHRKSKRYVFDSKLSHQQQLDLATRGVGAKSKKNDFNLSAKIANSKKPYSLQTDTQDISDSFNDDLLFLRDANWEDPLEKKLGPLLNLAKTFAQDSMSAPNEQFLKSFLQTTIGRSLAILSEIIEEVNISRLKHVRSHEFIFKRLPNYPIYVLIHPTSTDKHIFYSILVRRRDVDYVNPLAERLICIGDFYCTEFVSLDRHRITHLLYAQYKQASMMCFWHMLFGDNGCQEYAPNVRVRSHFWMACLVFLEDKERTSANLQHIRYAYMEVIKGGYTRSDPLKILNKIEHTVRSRLMVFCINRVLNAFSKMVEFPPRLAVDRTGATPLRELDRLEGLLSWVDQKPLRNFEEALNLSYLGVLHNKEEGDLVQGYLKIFDKVIDQEKKLRSSDSLKLLVGTSLKANDYGDHEFSATAVKAFSSFTKRYLESKYGDYHSWATDAIVKCIEDKTFADFATSKASATSDDALASLKEYLEEDQEDLNFNKISNKIREKGPTAKKCIENTKELMQNLKSQDRRPFMHLKQILDELEQAGGIKVKLFKKLQIGGTREIFILPIRARIAINFLESVCRKICDELPCEMLTKGDQKILRSDFHFNKKIKTCSGRATLTCINSDDAATWAQRFVMPVFGVMLSELVPEPFLTPCIRILNLVTSKQLILPRELLLLFESHRQVATYNPSIQSLKEEYLLYEVKDRCLVKTGQNLLQNRSNMMQGILHYTSSLLHSTFITSLTSYVETTLNSPELTIVDRAVVTGKVSSDDSSLLITASLPSGATATEASKACILLTLFSKLKGVCYPLFCAKQSYEKSTESCFHLIEEFNSLWYFRNTLIAPSIKFVAASVRTHVTDKIEIRQNVMYGLKSQVLENTGSIFMTSVVESCQARAHYIALGANASGVFTLFEKAIKELPHPALGFFLMEHHLLCGILGPKFQKYLAVKRSSIVSKITKMVFSTTILSEEAMDTCFSSFAITQGSRTRYYKMLDRMGLKFSDVIDFYDNHPSLAFDKAKTKEEAGHHVDLKAVTPSLANSFEFLTDSKQHAASSYVLHAPCVYLKRRVRINKNETTGIIDSEVDEVKLSLVGLIHYVKRALTEGPASALDQREESIIFPNASLYSNSIVYAKQAERFDKQISRRERKMYVSIAVPKTISPFLASPVDVCRAKWFGTSVRHTTYEINQTFSVLRKLYHWLGRSLTETLENSPLNSTVAVAQFLRSLPSYESKIHILGSHHKLPSVQDNVFGIIRRCQWPRVFLFEAKEFLPTPVSPKRSRSPSPSTTKGKTPISPSRKTPDPSPRTPEPSGPSSPPRTPQQKREERRRRARERSLSPAKGPLVRTDKQMAEMAFSGKPAGAKERANTIATALWYNSALPDETNGSSKGKREAERRVERIFEQNLPILSEHDMKQEVMFSCLDSRESTLAIMQYAALHGGSDISSILHCAKRGLVGSYVQAGTYDSARKMYTGTAIYKGTYNKINFEISSFDEKVCSLSVKDENSLYKLLQGFIPIIKDLKLCLSASMDDLVRCDRRLVREPLWLDMYNQELTKAFRPGRVAIIYTDVKPFRVMASINSILKVKGGTLRLFNAADLAHKKRGRKVPLLSYTPKKPSIVREDWVYEFNRPVAKKVDHWVGPHPYDRFLARKNLTYLEGEKLIKAVLSEGSNSINKISPSLEKWVKTTLLARAERAYDVTVSSLAMSKMLSGNLLEDENPQELLGPPQAIDTEHFSILESVGEFDDFESMLSDIDNEIFLKVLETEDGSLGQELETDDEPPKLYSNWADYDPEEEIAAQISEYAQTRPALQEEIRKDVIYESRFWDGFLNTFKKYALVEMRNEAFRGIYRHGASPSVELIAKLYGAEHKPYLIPDTESMIPESISDPLLM
uniref:RNA-directed RNA polymerase L n=1 Tax=Wuhan Spider Virus TaxID=1608136 RepID=A0A0B5KFC2_9VIRU|nr:RNA-dependent RNA polymerase [Wuhan Spider Virus]